MHKQLQLLLLAAALVLPHAARAATRFVGEERQITHHSADQYDPAVSGSLVVYTDARGADRDVYYFDLATGIEHQVTAAQGAQELSDVFGGKIVYTDYSAGDVVLFDVESGVTLNLTGSSTGQAVEPAIGSQLVAWQDNRDGNWEIYARDLATGVERRVSSSPTPDMAPATSGGIVVWERCSSPTSCSIAAWDWETQTTRLLTDKVGDERRPDISGDWVVYEALREGERDVYAFQLSTGIERRLELPGAQRNPNISGDYVAFEDLNGGTSDIMLWILSTDTVFQVTADVSEQFLNDIDGNRIVYTDDRNGQLDIYMFEFELLDASPPPLVDCDKPGNSVPLVDVTLKRKRGHPGVFYVPFKAGPAPALVCIENGPGKSQKVMAGLVMLNGDLVALPLDFLRQKNLIEAKGTLSRNNRLWVLMASQPGSAIRVRIYAAQAEDDSIVGHEAGAAGEAVDPDGPLLAEPSYSEERMEEGGAGAQWATQGGPDLHAIEQEIAILEAEAALQQIDVSREELLEAVETAEAEPMPGYGCSQSGPGSFAAMGVALLALLVLAPRRQTVRVRVRARRSPRR